MSFGMCLVSCSEYLPRGALDWRTSAKDTAVLGALRARGALIAASACVSLGGGAYAFHAEAAGLTGGVL